MTGDVDPLISQYRDRRHKAGVKPYILAELAGVSPQIVYTAEAGSRDPRLSTLRAWADALGCDLELVPRPVNTERRAA